MSSGERAVISQTYQKDITEDLSKLSEKCLCKNIKTTESTDCCTEEHFWTAVDAKYWSKKYWHIH